MRSRKTGLMDVFIAGFVLGLVYSLFYLFSPSFLTSYVEIVFWLIGILWGVFIYLSGFDYRRILFSFSLTFLSIVSIIYVSIIILIFVPGYPRSLALFITPFLTVSIICYLVKKIVDPLRARRKLELKINFSKRVKTTFFKLDPIMWAFLIAGLIILIVFLITPLLMMLYHAFEVPPGKPITANFERIFFSHLERGRMISSYVRLKGIEIKFYDVETLPDNTTIIVFRGVNLGILLNSLINASIVTIVSTFLGVVVAFVLARYDFPGRGVFRILAMIPLFVTPFVNAYVIRILFSDFGPISMITNWLFGWKIRIEELAGVALAQIMAFYPIVYLNAYSSFLNIDPSTEEQAENLGARGLRLFFTVTLPLALPGIVAGSILVFIFSLEDLGAPIVFQERRLMSYQIYSSFTSESGLVSPEMAALGFVMLILAALAFIAIRSYVGMRQYAMISRGGRWIPREHKLGWKGLLFVYFVLLPLILFTASPQIGAVLLAFNILPPRGFELNFDKATPKYFLELFENPDVFMYIRNTLIYALMAVGIATVIAIMIAYSVSRANVKLLTPTIDTLATIPLAIPGLVIALGYYYFYSTFFKGTPLDPVSGPTVFQAWVVLVIAYSIRKLPFVVRSVYAGFQQAHISLEEAALNLGASRSRVIFGVILPFILTYIVSGAIIGFIYICTEVSTSITIGGLRPDQAPMTFYMKYVYSGGTTEGVQIAAAMGVLLILFQLFAVFLIVVVFKQRYAFIGV